VGKLNGELLGLSKSDMSTWTTNDDWVEKLAGVTWDDSSPRRIKKIEWDGRGLGGYLSVSGLSGLEVLECAENGLVGIDISVTPALVELWCYSNPLRDITVDWSIPKSTTALGSSRDEWLLRHIFYVATATLHVPVGTLGLYRSAEGWRLFYSITEDSYVGNINVARPSVSVFLTDNLLTINSSSSEVITLYSLSGVTLLQQAKDEGSTTIDLSRLPKGVILVSGSSGWVRKVLR
jgi:hypothetical protein